MDLFREDSFHYFGSPRFNFKAFLKDSGYRYIFYLRQCQAGGIRKLVFSIPRKCLSHAQGLEISPAVRCGGGLYIGHPYGITVNSRAVLGMNVNLHKGVTIGQENRGRRKGCPTLGNCVSVGINSSIVGKVTIGDDVLIAPNTYINCDVPSHSIVLGSPCRIIPREGATENYIINRVDFS